MHRVVHLEVVCEIRHELLIPLYLDFTQALILRWHAADALEPAFSTLMEDGLVLRYAIPLHLHLNLKLMLGTQ